MKVLIVEDEVPAVAHLTDLLARIDPSIEILGNLDSVKSAVNWFNQNQEPDLLFLDIQLADGKSFEIFEELRSNARSYLPQPMTNSRSRHLRSIALIIC